MRDTGGADYGIRDAVAAGHMLGPRLFVSGRAHQPDRRPPATPQARAGQAGMRVLLGPELLGARGRQRADVIKAVRDELRKGADHIKIMCSGGVACAARPAGDRLQYRMDEIEAACEEADALGRYAAAHAYSAEAIRRAVKGGDCAIEHGNLIDADAAALMAQRGGPGPTLVAYDAMKRRAHEFGMLQEYSLAKN